MNCAVVNGVALDMKEELERSLFFQEDFLDNTVEDALIREYAAAHNIANTDEELQVAVDEWRYQRDLEDVEKLNAWLKSRHQTGISLQNGIDSIMLRNKVRNSIPKSAIDAYFAEHQLEFDQVELYSIRVETLERAQELFTQITQEGANFHAVAMEHSTDSATRPTGGYVGRLPRKGVTPPVEAAVFSAKAGDVVGPLKSDKGYNVFKVGAVHKASLEAERDGIQMQLFTDLLAGLRAKAQIRFPLLEDGAVNG